MSFLLCQHQKETNVTLYAGSQLRCGNDARTLSPVVIPFGTDLESLTRAKEHYAEIGYQWECLGKRRSFLEGVLEDTLNEAAYFLLTL